MSPYVEQQLNLHYYAYRAQSPFVQMGLDEARAKKMIRSFQAITKKLSKYKHFMSDEDAFSNVNCAVAGVWASKRDGKPVTMSYMIEDFVEEASFDYAKGGLRLAYQGFTWFYTHYQRKLYGQNAEINLDSLRLTEDEGDEDILSREAGNAYEELFSDGKAKDPMTLADISRIRLVWEETLDSLPSDERAIVEMLMEDIKQTEIAKRLGVSNTWVSIRKQKLRSLEAVLKAHGLERKDIELFFRIKDGSSI